MMDSEVPDADLRGPRSTRAAAVALIAILAAGCAAVRIESPLDDPRAGHATGAIRRCSPADPDRSAWFCVVGQLLYNVAGGMQPDGGYSFR